ncbi:TetR/AcrR family transcriptional regulator [Promicromonospora iranensis]|uniref:AcrR family transcriptional regulator n=1 Tax=Promicromonospora iranensis TaxID=1105144 RepID=A0ABU2CKR7_9MICO|nr:TetR/AcrR family transcriptional regulator [Promicromonospora iranensis]MDR7381934.1 AcrR family transcriptional regulator [Promicromonospora iranensis]
MEPTSETPSLRERTRRAVHAEITDTALRLFAEQGFEATTVEQIATAAGISRRSFFHYFRSKEDVVLGDLEALGRRVRDALEARPESESAWDALREALKTLHAPGSGAVTALEIADMYADAPSLRAKHLEKHLRWQELFAPDIERRLGIAPGTTADPRARAVIAAALACLDTAVEAWRESGGTADPVDLFDAAVAAVRG